MTFKTVLDRMAAIHTAKNADYGNSYELSARLLGRPVVEGLLHRMSDKLSRACKLAQGQTSAEFLRAAVRKALRTAERAAPTRQEMRP